MKYYLLYLLLISHGFIYAQQEKSIPVSIETSKPEADFKTNFSKQNIVRLNSIKFNLYGLIVNNYPVSYERMIRPNLSFQISYRYQPYNYFIDGIAIKKLAEHGAINPQYFNFKIANYAVTGEVRLYISKKHLGKGVFLGVYGRYTHFDIDNVDYNFASKNEIIYNVPLISNLSGFGGGISSGRKWIIKKRIIVEFYSGIHYLKLNGMLTSNKDLSGLSDQDKSNLKDNVENVFTFNKKTYLTATVSDKGISGTISGLPIGIISGLSIGFVF